MPDVHGPSAGAPGSSPARTPLASTVNVEVAARTHIGKVRETNEDAFVVCRNGRYLERVVSSLPEAMLPPLTNETAYLMMVADGMGGSAAGEVASHTALATVIDLTLNTPHWVLKLDDPETREAEIAEIYRRAREFVAQVHAAVRGHASTHPSLAGMGTTFTAAYSVGADLFVTHVGDSRAYVHRGGTLQRITRDHTLAQSYIDLGMIPEGDPAAQRLRHVLTQAVGAGDEDLDADFHLSQLGHDDRLLLCTDGLTGLVDEVEIAEVLGSSLSCDAACEALIERALDYGGRDNITVIVARYRFEGA